MLQKHRRVKQTIWQLFIGGKTLAKASGYIDIKSKFQLLRYDNRLNVWDSVKRYFGFWIQGFSPRSSQAPKYHPPWQASVLLLAVGREWEVVLQSALQGPVTKLQGCAEQLIAFCQQRMGLQIPRSHAKCAWGFAKRL